MPVKSTVIFPTGATGLQVGFPPNVEVLGLQPGKTFVVGLVTTDSSGRFSIPIMLGAMPLVFGLLATRLRLPPLVGYLIAAVAQDSGSRAGVAGLVLTSLLVTAVVTAAYEGRATSISIFVTAVSPVRYGGATVDAAGRSPRLSTGGRPSP